MQYKGKVVVLDNFRGLYKDYSVDIQDVIRSAILDGVDITGYINSCKDDPFRLDQIRLCLKEGIDELGALSKYSGEVIMKFRALKSSGKDVGQITVLLSNKTLSVDHVLYALQWVTNGRDISGLNLRIIPRDMLPLFDSGLGLNLDMSVYNTGKKYSEDLVKALFILQKKGYDVTEFLGTKGGSWDTEVLKFLATVPQSVYNSLVGTLISGKTPLQRVKIISELLKILTCEQCLPLMDIDSNGEYAWSFDSLDLILSGLRKGLKYETLICSNGSVSELKVILSEDSLNNSRKISGKLRKRN